ncbi:MAG: apolipoprotein N-acyltransferase [Alphaproteobacteria bacterium]|nr:apolipoprotein N-acyltransferase [Alphaproteobacteria bacterium]
MTGALARWRERVVALRGWRRALVALLLGALLALALPPFHLVPLGAIALTGFVWLIDGTRGPRGAFAVGWAFGFGHFLAGLFWIVNALLIFGWKYLPVYPIVVGFLPSILALFTGLAAMATRAVPFRGPGRVLALAGLWLAAEWLRGVLFSGFPWNLIGYAWAFSDPMLQIASVFGIWGLSLVTVAACAMPTVLAERPRAPVAGLAAIGAAGLVLVAVYGFGAMRLAGAPAPGADPVPGVALRIVQPDVEQVNKWDRQRHEANFLHHLQLSAGEGRRPVTHVIWPETAATFFLAEQKPALDMVARVVPPGGLLLTGAPRRSVEAGERHLWNSLLAIDDRGSVTASYDKFHLVPLGEYVPFKDYLPLTKIVQGASDYSAGPGPRTLRLAGLPPLSPLICYEVIFPGHVVDRTDRPKWLLNITNDGWYGDSPGPRQHFAQARLRAVEEGLPLVRSANTGISGVIDAYGRVVAKLELGRAGVLDAPLPQALGTPTPFARLGDWAVLAMLLATAVAALAFARTERS